MESDVLLLKTSHHHHYHQQQERENDQKEKKGNPPPPTAMWSALKRSLHCKPTPSEVYDPKAKEGFEQQLASIANTGRSSKGRCRSGCSRSISNLRDVIHGSKRHPERPPNCSPRSIGSSEFLNPLTHEVILSSSTCELKITGTAGEGGAPGNFHHHHHHNLQSPPHSLRGGSNMSLPRRSPGGSNRGLGAQRASSRSMASNGSFLDLEGGVGCHKCGEKFGKWEDVEEHHVANHSVTELIEGDSSRKIVEIICKASWIKTDTNITRIERVLKVHNTPKMLGRFEEHREMVKLKASKLPKKHPRCLADGNELLRFHGASLACNLGMNGTSNLCNSEKCSVCRIIRNGFSIPREPKNSIGVFTASTSGRALQSIKTSEENPSVRKALLVCRVIAGRVHKPLENIQEIEGQTGFDSLAGKVGLYANIEELYLLNPRLLLPCFVVIYKP